MIFGRLLWWPLAILLVGGSFTASVVVDTQRSNARVVQTHAQDAVDQVLVQVDVLLRRYQYGLLALRGAIAMAGAGQIDRAGFQRYSDARDYKVEFPGARGFGFIRRVAAGESAAYVAAQRRNGWPDFALHEFAPHGGDRAVIEMIAPVGPGRKVIGLDIASDRVRWAGAVASSASGAATLTAPLTLVQEGGRLRQSFLLLLPVYADGGTAPARPVVGWTFAPLVIGDVLATLPGNLPDGAFTLTDSAPGQPPVRFYAVGAGAGAYGVVRQTRRVLGRDWVAAFQPSPVFVAQLGLPEPLHAGIIGATLTLLCAALGGMLAADRARQRSLHDNQERLVLERTMEVEAARRDLRTILDAVPSMIGYFDAHQRIQYANRAYCDWFVLSVDDMFGRPMRELLPAELYRLNEPYVDAVLWGERQVFERVAVGRDGLPRNFLAKYLPDIRDGGVQGFYVLINDVSEVVESRQALASALRENDVLVRTINEQMLYSVTDAEGVILEVNDNFCAGFGYRRDQLIGVHHRLLSDGQHDRAFWADMRETVTAGRTWIGTACYNMADGSTKWFDTVVAPYFNQHGVIERYVALHTDVTARHAADTALRHVSALLGNVLRAATEMSMVATDTEGMITVFNAGAERMLGYTAAEMVGHCSAACLHDHQELAVRSAELSREMGEPVEGLRTIILTAERDGADAREWAYVRKDGSRFPVLLTVTAIRDDSGVVLGYLGIGVDISQRKRDDAILRESMQRAEQASVAKSQFVANMSHEIRTPMNAMLGMLALMLRTELSGRQRDYVDKAKIAGATLLALLNDVLDFSRIDAGKLELDLHDFDVDVLLRDLATVLAGNSVNPQVALLFDIAPAIPARLHGDGQRIQQVLVNLAGNALKFTPSGKVVVAMDVLATSPGSITLRFAVTDTGIGIPETKLGMIFDGFTQAEASTARRFGGTGLGLAISARIVALMGGTLEVRSEVGRGSRFWCDITFGTVPDDAALPAAPAPVAPPQLQQRLAGLRLLVVEDNPLNRQVAYELLASEGALVDLAEGGQQGVDMATGPRRAYDAVIMDVQMPDVDGLEATRRVRAVPRLARLPIMAMTANVSNADRDACLAAGMDSHIGKPFDIDEVVARVRGLIERNADVPLGAAPVAALDASAPLVDLAGALPRFFDDTAVYESMLAKFERESGQLLARLEGEQAGGDARAAAATRHALKGMALTMGLPRLAHALAAPEVSAPGYPALQALVVASVSTARAALVSIAASVAGGESGLA
jgi:PAS domain S-box-containing protein